jgi:hypothetical protein
MGRRHHLAIIILFLIIVLTHMPYLALPLTGAQTHSTASFWRMKGCQLILLRASSVL